MIKTIALLGFLSASTSVEAVTLSQHIQQEGSHASLTLELPFVTLQQLSKQLIKPTYSGSKGNPTSVLKKDTLTWDATPTPLRITERGDSIIVQASAQGTARIRGKLLFQSVSVSADLTVKAQVAIKPTIKSDWSVSPNAAGSATLSKADLYGISIRSRLQPDLKRAFDKALVKFNAKLATPGFLKVHAQDFWNKICATGSADREIGIIPKSIAITQPKVNRSGLRITLVVSGQVSTAKSNPAQCPAMPEKLILLN